MEQIRKVYVDIILLHSKEGIITPLEVIWEDGRRFEVQCVLDRRPAASMKAGGAGIRYTCIVEGKQTYLFLEEDKWFVEGKQ